jgi:hypothetical protein
MALVDDIRNEILAVMAANELELDGAVAKYNFADKLAHKMIQAASGGSAAEDVTYDNLLSGLTATDVQAAIDELAGGFKYWNGNYQHFHQTQSAITATSGALVFAANVLYAFPIEIKEDVTISELQIAYTAGVAGNSVYGLYGMENGLPKNKIFQTTAFNNLTTGFQTYTLPTPLVVKKGIYFVAYNTSSAPSVYTFNRLAVKNIFGSTWSSNFGSISVIRLTAGYTYTGTLPATFGLPVDNTLIQSVPAVLFKI